MRSQCYRYSSDVSVLFLESITRQKGGVFLTGFLKFSFDGSEEENIICLVDDSMVMVLFTYWSFSVTKP